MNLPRRRFLHLAAGAAALPAASRIARAQAYPTRPVRIIVGQAAGSGSDTAARLIGQWISERVGQPLVIENRPGGGTNIGTEAVVRAPADGHTLLLIAPDSAINATLYDKLNFNFIRDIGRLPRCLRHRGEPVGSCQDSSRIHRLCKGQSRHNQHGVCWHRKRHTYSGRVVQDDGRGQPGSCALSRRRAGVQVQVMFPGTVASIEYIRAGRLRALAVTTATRSETLPGIPTMAEFVQGYEASQWFGIGAPKNTPADIVAREIRSDGVACLEG